MKNLRFGIMLATMVAAIALSGCANQQAAPEIQLAQIYGQTCASYTAGITAATAAKKADKLTPDQIDAISKADAIVAPICTGPTPTDLAKAVTDITASVTTILINVAAESAK